MSLLEGCYPFDGQCKCSKDADFTLSFDDKSFLKVPKILLELASPVLKTTIKERQHEGKMLLKATSKDAWVLILNHIHPVGTPNKSIDNVTAKYMNETIELLTECRKYDLASLQTDIDERLARNIAKASDTHFAKIAKSLSSDKPIVKDADGDNKSLETLFNFDLPMTEGAFVSYLIRVLQENEDILRRRTYYLFKTKSNSSKSASGTIKDIVERMHKAGCHRLCSLFAQEMMKNDIRLDISF
eukprot:g3200.t1